MRIPDDLLQTRVANHFAVAARAVHGVPPLHGWMQLAKLHPTIQEASSADKDTQIKVVCKVCIWRAESR